jgi:uncharacterized protein YdhG (YjbR/CyaY superfamily)
VDPDAAVDEYFDGVPEPRRAMLEAIRDVCEDELGGFEESMAYRMPSYRRDGEIELAFANQKQYVSLYVLRTDVVEAHRSRLGGLDVGKGCVRFRRPEQLDLDVVRSMIRATAASRGPVC